MAGSVALAALFALVLVAALLLAPRYARARRAEELRSVEQQQRVDLLMRATKAGLFDWDAVTNRTTYSERLKEMLGYSADTDTRGWPLFFEFIHPDDRERVRNLLLSQLRDRSKRSATRSHEPADYRARKADGSYLWVQAEAISLTGADGRTLRYICSFIDISERKQQQIELAGRATFVAELVDALPISVALRDPDGRYVLVNRTWEQYFGVKREDALGKRRRELPGWQGDPKRIADADEIERLDREALARGPGYVAEPQETLRLGRHYLITRRALFDSGGKPIGVLSAGIDMTERREQDEQLRNQFKFINDLFDAVPLSLALRDTEGRFIRVNRAWEQYFHLSRADILEKRLADLPGWQDDPRLREQAELVERLDRDALQRGPADAAELEEQSQLGRVYLNTRRAFVDTGGRPIGVLSASVDITERRAQQEALRNQFKFVNDLVESVPVAVAMRDTEGRYLLVNRTWEQYFGALREDVLGHTVRERVPEPMASALLALDREVLERGSGAMLREDDYEYRGRRYTQTRSVMADAQGKVLGVLIASLDTTARYEMELALEHERERLQLLVRATKAGFMDWDARADKQIFSERFKELLGYARDADTSGWPSLFDMMHPDDREPMRDAFRQMLHRVSSTGERLHGPLEYRLRKADGSYLWVHGEGIAKIGDDGRTERFLTSYVDITHLRELNRALEESVRLREEVDRMSRHDLKTPLNAIIGISRLMQEEGRLSAEDAHFATRIEEAGFRLLSMINLSLDMFRMEQGTYPFSPKAVDLRDVLDKVVRDLRSHAKAKRASVRIEGGAAHAWGEELLCYSMLANVTKNAIEASPAGGTVTVSIQPAEEGVSIRIHNAGAVPEAMRGRFFEKYSTAGKQGGLGLGTYSARLMARTQMGDIEMQTSETAGTTLAVRLSAAAAPQAERDSGTRSAPPAPQLSSLADGHSILVVDDDEFSRLVVQRLLPASSRVSLASNGREALDAVLVDPPDAIVMDLDMPVMGGLEAAARIRASEKECGRKRCTMIAASSHDDEATRLRALEAGFDAYLEKPVSADALRRLLADFFLAGEPVHVDPDLRDLLPGFLRSRRELAAELAEAVEAGAAERARALAHKLAGSLLPYGFHWAARQGKMIEQRARQNALEGLAAEVRALREHLDTVEVRVEDATAEEKR
jgi:PAS domain S-box-containing protein